MFFFVFFCPFFHQKICLSGCKYLYACKKSWGIRKKGSQEAAGAGNVKKKQKKTKKHVKMVSGSVIWAVAPKEIFVSLPFLSPSTPRDLDSGPWTRTRGLGL